MTDTPTPPTDGDARIAEIRERARDFKGALEGTTVYTFANEDIPWLLDRLAATEQQRDAYKALALAAEGVLVDAPALAVRERERAERAEAALDAAERDLAWVQTAVANNSAVCEACAAEIARVCGWGAEGQA